MASHTIGLRFPVVGLILFGVLIAAPVASALDASPPTIVALNLFGYFTLDGMAIYVNVTASDDVGVVSLSAAAYGPLPSSDLAGTSGGTLYVGTPQFGAWRADIVLLPGVTDGTFVVDVTAADEGGNVAIAGGTVIVDGTPPVFVAVETWVAGEGWTPGIGVRAHVTDGTGVSTVSGIAFDPSGTLSGSGFLSFISGSLQDGIWEGVITLSPIAPDGIYRVEIKGTDGYFNAATYLTGVAFARAPPETEITSIADGRGRGLANSHRTRSTSITFTFEGVVSVGNVEFECALDGASFTSCASPMTYAGLGIGDHTFAVRARDRLGRADPTPATFAWLVLR